MEETRIIVCGVDGSPAGQRAVGWALQEALRSSATVRAVTVWSWDGFEALNAPSSPGEAHARARGMLDRSVDLALTELEDRPEVERICERGVPSEALCATASDAALIVLGSHGHGSVHDKLLGSTSERVIHHAPCPVVVIPDPRHVERNRRRARQRRKERARPAQLN